MYISYRNGLTMFIQHVTVKVAHTAHSLLYVFLYT